MRALYLPYEVQFDEQTRTYCLSGEDRNGQPFGVGSGATREESEQALRDYVLEVLEVHASEGDDRFGDLFTEKPQRSFVAFGVPELLPILLRLARARARLRQSDMAARLGITQQAYAKLEKPGANPTLRTLLQAEEALGVPLLEWHWSLQPAPSEKASRQSRPGTRGRQRGKPGGPRPLGSSGAKAE